MPFSSLPFSRRSAPPSRVREHPGSYWERRNWQLRRILQAGHWTIHDVLNRQEVRAAVTAQWRLARRMDEDRQVDAYIDYLEYLDAVARGVLPSISPPQGLSRK